MEIPTRDRKLVREASCSDHYWFNSQHLLDTGIGARKPETSLLNRECRMGEVPPECAQWM